MKRIKVLYVITALGIGGAEKLLLSIIQKLDRKTFAPIVVSLYNDCTLYNDFKKTGARIFCLKYSNKYNPFILFRLIQLIRCEKPDIVHTHLPHATIWGRIAARLSDIKTVFSTEHNLSVWKRKHFIFYLLYRVTCKWNFKIIAVSKAIKKKIAKEFSVPEQKIVVIHNGIDIAEYNDNIECPDDLTRLTRPIIGTVGRLHRIKGHKYLVAAFSKTIQRFPTANLLVVGDGDQRDDLNQQITELGLNDSVHLLGSRDDVRAILQHIDIFVFPSLEEGLGIALIEACMVGKPYVATNVGGIPEIIKDGKSGFLVPPSDSVTLGEKIVLLLENNEKYKKLASHSQQVVKNRFNIYDKVRILEELYLQSIKCYR